MTKEKEPKIVRCDFCGDTIVGNRVRYKYCSDRCSQTAARRRVNRRLGIPPPRSKVSKLSDPLYFN